MNKSPGTEPSTILMSMTLTALSAAYIDFTKFASLSDAWKLMMASVVFIFGGTSTAQLYFSLIIPKLKAQQNFPLSQGRNTKLFFLYKYYRHYILLSKKFFYAQCSANEIRMLGYLNGLIAFFLLVIVQFFYILEKSIFLLQILSKFQ